MRTPGFLGLARSLSPSLSLSRSRSLSVWTGILLALASWVTPVHAADHGDAPLAASNRSTDIADVYAFLDPNDNDFAVLIMTLNGFIVPGEAANFGFFDPALRYRFDLETTGDARGDREIDVWFDPREGSASSPQRATVRLPSGRVFRAWTTAPTTGPSANPFTLTTDSRSGVSFFAGLVDDPFFFDIPATNAFISSILGGAPDPSLLARGRDTFAGYNVLSIALRVPVSEIYRSKKRFRTRWTGELGVQGLILRPKSSLVTPIGVFQFGSDRQVERMGNPGVNVTLVPFARKNAYNLADPADDARGRFADSIVATLQALGTNDENIGILADVAVTRGDYLRLDLEIENRGLGGGTNVEAAFPNGRRPGDDVIDTLLFLIANQTPIGDSVDANDVVLGDTFPFLAPQQTALPAGTADDNTRN